MSRCEYSMHTKKNISTAGNCSPKMLETMPRNELSKPLRPKQNLVFQHVRCCWDVMLLMGPKWTYETLYQKVTQSINQNHDAPVPVSTRSTDPLWDC